MITSDSGLSVTQRNRTEGLIPRKIKKEFIKYLRFPYTMSLNRFRKYGIYCPDLDYEREKSLHHSPSSIKRMKFIHSLKLRFPKAGGAVLSPAETKKNNSVFNQYFRKELKKLSRMIRYAKGLHSFTLYLECYDIEKEQGLNGFCKKLKSLKETSSLSIQFPFCNINEVEVERLLKIATIQKKLSKLDIDYQGCSILETGLVSLNKTMASYQNLSDLSVHLRFSLEYIPSMTVQFFSELSRLTELKALTLTFPIVVDKDKNFFESITKCFKNLKNLKRLNLIFQVCPNIEDENLQIMARQLSEFNELSHLSLDLGKCINVNTAIENISNSVQALKKLKTFSFCIDLCRKVDDKALQSSINKISAQTSLTSLTLYFGVIKRTVDFIMLGNLYQLKSLDLKFDSLSNEKISSISKTLSCLKGLESFSLGIYASNESDIKVYCLADALTSTKLKSLTLKFLIASFLTDHFCYAFKEPLSKLQELEYLDLYFPSSQFENQGIVAIASALISLRKLLSLKLNFYNCQNKDKSLEAIGNAILNMNHIRLLSLTFGQQSLVTSQGSISIGETISKLHSLEDLSLNFYYCNNIEEDGVKRLCEFLKKLKQLQVLYLNFKGSIRDKFMKEVVDSLKNSIPFLKSISF